MGRVSLLEAQQDAEALASQLSTLLRDVGRPPRPQERWVVKLNLTYPIYVRGAVNSPLFVEALCILAAGSSVHLTFVEGDGGNGSYSASEAFDGHGLNRLGQRYGCKCVALTSTPWTWRSTEVCGSTVTLPYSEPLLDRQFDAFISAPVIKNHVFTTVSLGFKNLWGCIPDPHRMYLSSPSRSGHCCARQDAYAGLHDCRRTHGDERKWAN